jgi:uncharacterized protein (TIGR03437 family)
MPDMLSTRSHSRALSIGAIAFGALVTLTQPAAAQTVSVTQFIANVESTVANFVATLPPPNHPIIFGGQNILAYGSAVPQAPTGVLLDYADGLKAAGVQRMEFNPGVTTINNTTAAANYDALVKHTRELGMYIAINPEYLKGEFNVVTFQDFITQAMTTYPALAQRYQPDNFVIVHEPTTQTARMGITVTPAEWDSFIRAVEPLIKAASPRTRVGAGDCSHCNEDSYFADFVAIPTCDATNVTTGCLDFVTVDLYTQTTLPQVQSWAQSAHANNKGIYMEETWAPKMVSGASLAQIQANPQGAEAYTTIGSADAVFEPMDESWMQGMAQLASSLGMEAVTGFTTQTFFLYTNTGQPDKATDPAYLALAKAVIQQGQLTAMATSFKADVQKYGVQTATSLNNASYATLPTVFNPSCGSASNPCDPNSTIAPDMLVSAFGANLATQSAASSSFPTTLGGTTATLLDSTNTSYPLNLYSVSKNQVNYIVPNKAALGSATVTITAGDGTVTAGIVQVSSVNPGLYTASSNGQGGAAAIAVCSGTCSGWPNKQANGQYWQYTFVGGCTSGNCLTPISFGANDTVVIELFGTGIRHSASTASVSAVINGTTIPVQYAGQQGADSGLDQVNVQVPANLAGAGQVTLTLTVLDPTTNTTTSTNTASLNLQ